jgi:hypothetical protein
MFPIGKWSTKGKKWIMELGEAYVYNIIMGTLSKDNIFLSKVLK